MPKTLPAALTSSVSFQFQIYAPSIPNQNQFVFQKYNDTLNHGFGCYLSQSASPSTAQLTFFVSSGSVNVMSASINLVKGDWSPITFTWDRTSGINQLYGYVGGKLVASSTK